MKVNKILLWVLRVVPAFIMLQTLYFKFTAHPDSVLLFEALGAGSTGRIGIGAMELIASILLLIPKTTKFGALIAMGLMAGAIGSHLFILGINYNGDGGALFGMAVVAFLASLALVWLYREELLGFIQRKS